MKPTLETIEATILHDGLRKYKFKNSQSYSQPTAEANKGAIFAWRSKAKMTLGQGVVITSIEALAQSPDEYTHWTPNVYCYGTYTDKVHHITQGHTEANLKQVNTFTVDIDITPDTESFSANDLLLESLTLGLMPTMILKTTRGYQMFFVLSEPAYVTSHSNFRVVAVAKKISQSLRQYFAQNFPVDMTCNHFGISRIPRTDNVEFFDSNYQYAFSKWIAWSLKQANEPSHIHTSTAHSKHPHRQVDEPWFTLLLNQSDILGAKGRYGRNNAIFTLALACYASELSHASCFEILNRFNLRLHLPISANELKKTIRSAYSGAYKAASRAFITPLLQQWVSSNLTAKDLFGKPNWVKAKQPRASRKNSFLSEWKADFTTFLMRKTSTQSPFLQTTQARISDSLGIPSRSLSKLLRLMQATGEIILHTRRGRNGGISIAHRAILASTVIQDKQATAIDFFYRVVAILTETPVYRTRRYTSSFRRASMCTHLRGHTSSAPGRATTGS
ncbi:primase C-terminal domain-containing protein [Lacticaseibacillus jixiensis]|uniref:primase C-terminal domain-containing protein n=1 Tax=Lacticaseibacillus jixiensis TaxID=3231926 RepID=UPI0036F3CEDE